MTNLSNPNSNVSITGYAFTAKGIKVTYAYGITAPAYKLREKYRASKSA